MTGASSFTGAWFAHALAGRGARVTAALNRSRDAGDHARQARIAFAGERCRIVDNVPFGSPRFLEVIERHGPFDALAMHGATVGDFRRCAYDAMQALASDTLGLGAVLDRLATAGCRRVVFTGSVFEADEGLGDPPLNAIGDYGLAKTLTWHVVRHRVGSIDTVGSAAGSRGMSLGKFVVPSPFGPMQKPGLVSHLIESWLRGETPHVRHPRRLRDHIHVDLLAAEYAAFVMALPMVPGLYRRGPSLYAEPLVDFARRLGTAMEPLLGVPCRIDCNQPEDDFDEPVIRRNQAGHSQVASQWDFSKSWKSLAEFYSVGVYARDESATNIINL